VAFHLHRQFAVISEKRMHYADIKYNFHLKHQKVKHELLPILKNPFFKFLKFAISPEFLKFLNFAFSVYGWPLQSKILRM